MAMMIRIEREGDREGRLPRGWLILEYGEANLFHPDDGSMSVKEVQHKYGAAEKAVIRVNLREWQRLLAHTRGV